VGKSIAFFDFDGTLTSRDSFADFLLYSFGYWKLIIAAFILSPILIRYVTGFIDNSKAKELLYHYFFLGLSDTQLKDLGEDYVANRLSKIIRPLGMQQVRWHLSEGHMVVIVTASSEYWVQPWAHKNGLCCIATKLDKRHGILTGYYAGLNCHGEEKVSRIKSEYDLKNFEKIYAYGDTPGDLPMLSIAHIKNYKPFVVP